MSMATNQMSGCSSQNVYCTQYSTCLDGVQEKHPAYIMGQCLRAVMDKSYSIFSNIFGSNTDYEGILNCLKDNAREFSALSCDLQNDKEFVLRAVRVNGLVLEYACAFQGDQDVVQAAVENTQEASKFATCDQNGDERVVVGTNAQQKIFDRVTDIEDDRIQVGGKKQIFLRTDQVPNRFSRENGPQQRQETRLKVGDKRQVVQEREQDSEVRIQVKRK